LSFICTFSQEGAGHLRYRNRPSQMKKTKEKEVRKTERDLPALDANCCEKSPVALKGNGIECSPSVFRALLKETENLKKHAFGGEKSWKNRELGIGKADVI